MIRLDDLEGVWRLTREIEDRRGGVAGRLEGTSRWLRDADGLRQEEEGVLTMGAGPSMQARRVYLWRAAGDGIEVLFEDGRPFHGLGSGRLSDRHWCDPDTYDVGYDFTRWPHWTQRWRVTGPRKDAVILSRFQPLG
jgi:hypothetical protein